MAIDRWTSGAKYEQWMGRWSRLLAREFLGWLNAPKRLRWLDLCCGSGIVTETILEASEPAAITGVDASSAQISFARDRRTHENVRFETGDAMALRFADASFDIAVCGLGLNFIPTPAQGLSELRRVVRPGGTIAVYVWDYEFGARFLRMFWDAARAVDGEAVAADQASRFPMCTDTGLTDLFEQASLHEIATRPLDIVTRFADFDDYWAPLMTGQGSAPNYLASRAKQIQGQIRERLRAALPAGRDGAIELPARAWAIRGRRA
jgi:SAM-dependent methyltransferase